VGLARALREGDSIGKVYCSTSALLLAVCVGKSVVLKVTEVVVGTTEVNLGKSAVTKLAGLSVVRELPPVNMLVMVVLEVLLIDNEVLILPSTVLVLLCRAACC
jgi:hypothetical protein